MDLQGKGFWLNMVLHNGAFGCLDCYTKGYHVKSGKGYAHCYPYSEYRKATLRTSQQFKDDAVRAQQSNKTVSVFLNLHGKNKHIHVNKMPHIFPESVPTLALTGALELLNVEYCIWLQGEKGFC